MNSCRPYFNSFVIASAALPATTQLADPRHHIDEAFLKELAASIRTNGIWNGNHLSEKATLPPCASCIGETGLTDHRCKDPSFLRNGGLSVKVGECLEDLLNELGLNLSDGRTKNGCGEN
jgi:hypothetical protein